MADSMMPTDAMTDSPRTRKRARRRVGVGSGVTEPLDDEAAVAAAAVAAPDRVNLGFTSALATEILPAAKAAVTYSWVST
jgi:autotransporter adhesin